MSAIDQIGSQFFSSEVLPIPKKLFSYHYSLSTSNLGSKSLHVGEGHPAESRFSEIVRRTVV